LIPDADIWRAALLIIRCFRRDAVDQAAACAEDLVASDADGAAMWRRIMVAIERLQAERSGVGEAVH